ncbi:hypothetical protein Pcinc_022455 [Petrolisthes cinctipes]|uniref:Uncharacterized protein n=1 Tax=Petrolisthes cinctipes TaxID=88211 RepID=A0AAE1FEP6_PETCI|nr:hypothetical protein Pcinc_022455 [Petrolisthes cinctipes]
MDMLTSVAGGRQRIFKGFCGAVNVGHHPSLTRCVWVATSVSSRPSLPSLQSSSSSFHFCLFTPITPVLLPLPSLHSPHSHHSSLPNPPLPLLLPFPYSSPSHFPYSSHLSLFASINP